MTKKHLTISLLVKVLRHAQSCHQGPRIAVTDFTPIIKTNIITWDEWRVEKNAYIMRNSRHRPHGNGDKHTSTRDLAVKYRGAPDCIVWRQTWIRVSIGRCLWCHNICTPTICTCLFLLDMRLGKKMCTHFVFPLLDRNMILVQIAAPTIACHFKKVSLILKLVLSTSFIE